MFLLYFIVFTLILTLFENISLAGISFLCMIFFLYIYQILRKKKVLTMKKVFFIILAFTLAMLAFGVKEVKYYGISVNFFKSSTLKGTPSFQIKEDKMKILIWTGSISDISSQGKYVFDYQNNEYLLYSKKAYSIWDKIRIVGRITPPTPSKIEGWWYRKISSWTFAVALFSGDFDFAKRMKMKGRKGVIYETNSILIDGKDGIDGVKSNPPTMRRTSPSNLSNPSSFIKQAKKNIQEKVINVYGKNKISGLILGMVIGDKSQIPEPAYKSFIDSGLVHLVAVSGWNILMIVVFLQFILFFLPFYVRLGVILLTIVGYSFICGLDSSVFRAMLMGGMNIIALFRGREINIWRILSISCIVMLLINPYFLVYDTGFLLSYSAIIGIIYFNSETRDEEQEKKDKTKNLIIKFVHYVYKNYISPSIWASIGIFPIIIFFMGKINIVWIVGNLFVLPIVPFVMIYGFVSVWIYDIFWWEWILWIEKVCIQYIYKISDLISQYGVYLNVSWLRCKYVVLILFVVGFLLWRKQPHSPE